jgi:hypothetical protein
VTSAARLATAAAGAVATPGGSIGAISARQRACRCRHEAH